MRDQFEFEGSSERKSENPVLQTIKNVPWHWRTRWVKVNTQEKLIGPCYNQDDIRFRDPELDSMVGRIVGVEVSYQHYWLKNRDTTIGHWPLYNTCSFATSDFISWLQIN